MQADKNIFTEGKRTDLLKKRVERLLYIRKIPFSIMWKIFRLYLKKLMGKTGTRAENELNYFFLTLINSNSSYKAHNKKSFSFRNDLGLEFQARQNGESDLEVFNQVWGRRIYQAATDRLKQIINSDKPVTIIDAGANVGYTTLFFLNEFPNASIISIEPDDENFEMLNAHLKNNGFENVKSIKAALWNKNCNLILIRDAFDGRSWSIRVEETSADTGIKAITLDDIIKRNDLKQIDLLKLDIEGAERKVFENHENARAIMLRTKVIALEIHDEIADRPAIYSFLTECGFEYESVEDITVAYRKN